MPISNVPLETQTCTPTTPSEMIVVYVSLENVETDDLNNIYCALDVL